MEGRTCGIEGDDEGNREVTARVDEDGDWDMS
jgi:hypothetical protein